MTHVVIARWFAPVASVVDVASVACVAPVAFVACVAFVAGVLVMRAFVLYGIVGGWGVLDAVCEALGR